jgi:hypothetical protein
MVSRESYCQRLWRVTRCETRLIWTSYRLWLTFAPAASAVLLDFVRKGWRAITALDLALNAVGGAMIAFLGTLVISFFRAPKLLDDEWIARDEEKAKNAAVPSPSPSHASTPSQNPASNMPEGLSTGAMLAWGIGLAAAVWLAWPVVVGLGPKEPPSEHTKFPAIIQQPSFGTPMDLPDGRTILSISPDDLQAAHHNNTVDQFNRLLGGRWIKISGKIRNTYGNGLVFLKLTEDYPLIVLHFGKGWYEPLSVLPLGSSMTIRGKVEGTDGVYINLSECELL